MMQDSSDMVMPSESFAIGPALHGAVVATPRHFYRVVEGVLVHWVEFTQTADKPAQKAPVVLLHGLNDSHLTWRQVAPALALDRRVLVLDLPGHGLSDRPDAGYELAWYARIVAAWFEVLGFEPGEQVDIVGHSLGGGIALMLLQVCRARIRRLVLAAPGGLGKEIFFLLRLASIPWVVERFGQPFMALGTRLALRRWRAKLPIGHIAELSAMNSRRGTARAFSRTVRGLMNWSGQHHSFYRRAHEIADFPPIAVLWGDRDAVLPLAHGKTLARVMEGVRLTELNGCGHYLHHDDPEAFLNGVREALDGFASSPVRVTAATSAPWSVTCGFAAAPAVGRTTRTAGVAVDVVTASRLERSWARLRRSCRTRTIRSAWGTADACREPKTKGERIVNPFLATILTVASFVAPLAFFTWLRTLKAARFARLLSRGALLVDVGTAEPYAEGHLNIKDVIRRSRECNRRLTK